MQKTRRGVYQRRRREEETWLFSEAYSGVSDNAGVVAGYVAAAFVAE
jgi:hypothetical protein